MKDILQFGSSVVIGLFIGFMFILGYFFFKGVAIAKKENKTTKNKNKN